MFAVVPRDVEHPLTALKGSVNNLLWESGTILDLGPLAPGDTIDYYVFQIPGNNIALQKELQERAYLQASLVHSDFKAWAERMEQIDTRRQEIMELEFVFREFGFFLLSTCSNPLKLRFVCKGAFSLEFDLEVDTKDSALKTLHQWRIERDQK